MPYIGNTPAESYSSVVKDTFSGDNSETAFTLSQSATTNGLRVVVDDALQEPTVDYTVSGATLTFTSAPATGTNNIYVIHLGAAVQTVAPPSTIEIDTTFTQGVSVTGNITVGGTVDGRDLATDGSKLDNIEANATADQTASEIKTAYESNSDTNAFTDAEQTKLSGIESGATADQTASEILTAIKTVDGAGSGLDADTLDGVQAASFLQDITGESIKSLSDVYSSMSPSDGQVLTYDTTNGWQAETISTTLDGLTDTTITSNTSGEILKWNGSAWVNNTLAEAGIQPSGSYLTGNQTITLSGDVSGSGTTSISVTVADDSHNHVISNVDGLQTALDAKAPLASPALTGTATAVNLSISGDLTVNGTTTTLNTTNTVVSDNLIELNNGASSNANDSGIVIERGTTGDNAFMGWDESADSFVLGTTTATGASTGNLTITAAPLSVSTLTTSGNITVGGTVDGRDVATDGTKLDGIESGATADQTASEILTALKTVDGAGSGLDADLLDGQSSAYYATASHNHTLDGLSNTTITSNTSGEILKWNGTAWINNTLAEAGIQPSGSYLTGNQTITLSGDVSGSGTTAITVTVADDSHNHIISNIDNLQTTLDAKIQKNVGFVWTTNTSNNQLSFESQDILESSSGDQATLEVYQGTAGADAFMQFHVASDYAAYFGLKGDINDFAVGGWSMGANYYRVWHAGNDGSGSGLDADTLDGVQGSSYLRSDATDTFTTLNGTQIGLGSQVILKEATDRADLLLIQSQTATWGGIQIGNSSGETLTSFMGDGANFGIYDDQQNEWVLYATENAGVDLRYNGTAVFATTSSGVSVTGSIAVSGTVDGRDVATDGTKLDGIESGATADQTASEILTAIKTVDGAASGLDADLLDGQQGSYYLNYNNLTNKPTITSAMFPDYNQSQDNATRSKNTWYQAAQDSFVTIYALGPYMNSITVRAGTSTSSYANIGTSGNDLNNNTWSGSFSFMIKKDSYFYVQSPGWGSYEYETLTIVQWW